MGLIWIVSLRANWSYCFPEVTDLYYPHAARIDKASIWLVDPVGEGRTLTWNPSGGIRTMGSTGTAQPSDEKEESRSC